MCTKVLGIDDANMRREMRTGIVEIRRNAEGRQADSGGQPTRGMTSASAGRHTHGAVLLCTKYWGCVVKCCFALLPRAGGALQMR